MRINGPISVLITLLLVCAVHGVVSVKGLTVPPDLGALRDIGFTQGILDGNWFGDPSYAGAVRYYPPLMPAIVAAFAKLTQWRDLPGLWVTAGPLLGLIPVITLFVFCRELAGPAAAASAAMVFVFWNSATTDPWIGGGYAPWLLVPLAGQSFFLLTATVIVRSITRPNVLNALLIGLLGGITFLFHAVPGILVTGILTVAAFCLNGLTLRTLGWLALAAVPQTIVMSAYLGPLLLAYPGGVVNTVPEGWTASVFENSALGGLGVILLNVPVIVGAAYFRRRDLRNPDIAIFFVPWIALCIFEIIRHYVCSLISGVGLACRIAYVPVHHYHLYLQVAGACLLGIATWGFVRRRYAQPRFVLLVVLMLAIGSAGLFLRPYDRDIRAARLKEGGTETFDLAAYRFILAETPPDALFVTPLGGAPDDPFDPGGFAVMAAGRKLVATHVLFSNPYVDWSEREKRRLHLDRWLRGGDPPADCVAVRTGLWAILENQAQVVENMADLVFRSPTHAIFRIRDARLQCSRMH